MGERTRFGLERGLFTLLIHPDERAFSCSRRLDVRQRAIGSHGKAGAPSASDGNVLDDRRRLGGERQGRKIEGRRPQSTVAPEDEMSWRDWASGSGATARTSATQAATS